MDKVGKIAEFYVCPECGRGVTYVKRETTPSYTWPSRA